MSCTNCFNGCEIVSDRCVKYTGIDIPELGIQTGDSLSHVEQSITTYLVSVLNGSGVKIDLTSINVCNTVQKYLPVCSNCTDVSIADISKALIKAACDLQVQIDDIVTDVNTINNTLTELNSTYSKVCLTSPPAGTIDVNDTHSVLQAVIDNFCALKLSLNQYITVSNIDAFIQAFLDENNMSNKYYNRMVPYTVVEYYGSISGNFDGTGKGLDSGPFEKIYLCNGANPGVPDKRGVVGVGITDGTMFGGTMDGKVNPGGFNPTYSINSPIIGDNAVTLVKNQMPAHSHTGSTAVTSINPATHSHTFAVQNVSSGSVGDNVQGTSSTQGGGTKTTSDVTISVNTVLTIVPEGQNLPHANNQPALGCYYIIYIP
jgi:microcystin-dependent protein